MLDTVQHPARRDTLRAYTPAQAADRLAVSIKTIDRMIDAGELRVFYPRGSGRGRPRRIAEAELRRILDGEAVR